MHEEIWQASLWLPVVAVVVVMVAVGFSARWPVQTEAGAAALSFFAATVLAYAAWKTLQSAQEQGKALREQSDALKAQAQAALNQARVFRDQWDEDRRVHLDMWAEVTPNPATVAVPAAGGGDIVLTVCPANLQIWNYSRHAVRLVGIEIGFDMPGSPRPRDAVIPSEGLSSQPITAELLSLTVSQNRQITPDTLKALAANVKIRLHYRGIAGAGATEPYTFSLRGEQYPRLAVTLKTPDPFAVAWPDSSGQSRTAGA